MPPPPHIIFTDFDGTITLGDATTLLIDRCIGKEARVALDGQMLRGERGFRDAVGYMWENVNLSREESEEILRDVPIDPFFPAFAAFCATHKIPLVIISSGLTFIVTLCVARALGPAHATTIREIVANGMEVAEGNRWVISWVDESVHGHDKARSIRRVLREIAEEEKVTGEVVGELLGDGGGGGVMEEQKGEVRRPRTYFIGDGVSDISAAKECDVLFAKRGLDLETWCLRENVPYQAWSHFGEVQQVLEEALRASGLEI